MDMRSRCGSTFNKSLSSLSSRSQVERSPPPPAPLPKAKRWISLSCLLLLLVKPDAHSCKRWSNGRGTGGRHAKLPKGIRVA